MKNAILLILIVFLLSCSTDRSEFIGTFESNPNEMYKFKEPISDENRELLRRLTVRISITDNEFLLYSAEKGPIKMAYTIHGECLVGEDKSRKPEFYFPIYFKDNNTIYGAGQMLRRIKE